MKVRRGLIAMAAGAILATAGAGYSAPAHQDYENSNRHGSYENNYYQGYYGNNDRQVRTGDDRGWEHAERGEQFDSRTSRRRGEAMEGRWGQFSREDERHERFGVRGDQD